MSIDRWLSLLGYIALIVAVLSICARGLDRLVTWAMRDHSKRLAKITSTAVLVIFGIGSVIVALIVWGALLYNAFDSLTQPSATTEDCRQEHDAKGPHTTCD